MSSKQPLKKARLSLTPSKTVAAAADNKSRSQTTKTTTTTSSSSSYLSSSSSILKFEDGSVQFRQRIVCSVLSQKPLLVKNIRADSLTAPGLTRCEASFLRLVADRLTNGTQVEINSSGTQFRLKPGVLVGGTVVHDCPVLEEENDDDEEKDDATGVRSIGWFLEGVLPLLCFGKDHVQLTLTGVTDGVCHALDPSPDYIREALFPLLTQLGIGADEGEAAPPPSLCIVQRGSYPHGGGVVRVFCPRVKELRPLDCASATGKIKRIRGTAVGLRIPPTSAARLAHAAKGIFHRLLPDVWIHTDTGGGARAKTKTGRPVPSLSVTLTATDTQGHALTVEACMEHGRSFGKRKRHDDDDDNNNKSSSRFELPEDLGIRAACTLLEEVRRGGCIDSGAQSLVLLLMCLTPEDVSRVRVGTLTQYSIQSLRLFRRAFGVEFKVRADCDTSTVLLSCLGMGYRNMARAST